MSRCPTSSGSRLAAGDQCDQLGKNAQFGQSTFETNFFFEQSLSIKFTPPTKAEIINSFSKAKIKCLSLYISC
jgi:hypothetical protein